MNAKLQSRRGVIVALAIALSACATYNPYPIGSMIPGRMVSVSEGKIFPMQIQVSSYQNPTGKIVTNDPVTGEILEGNYTALPTTTYVQTARPTIFGDQATATATQVSDTVPASATLVGNQGTVIVLKMQVKAGNPPIGFGEGEDNKGRKYTVQF